MNNLDHCMLIMLSVFLKILVCNILVLNFKIYGTFENHWKCKLLNIKQITSVLY